MSIKKIYIIAPQFLEYYWVAIKESMYYYDDTESMELYYKAYTSLFNDELPMYIYRTLYSKYGMVENVSQLTKGIMTNIMRRFELKKSSRDMNVDEWDNYFSEVFDWLEKFDISRLYENQKEIDRVQRMRKG